MYIGPPMASERFLPLPLVPSSPFFCQEPTLARLRTPGDRMLWVTWEEELRAAAIEKKRGADLQIAKDVLGRICQ
jgi:hypothetical protein